MGWMSACTNIGGLIIVWELLYFETIGGCRYPSSGLQDSQKVTVGFVPQKVANHVSLCRVTMF